MVLSQGSCASFMDKTQSRDKDIRYMAASDLLAELDGRGANGSSGGSGSSGGHHAPAMLSADMQKRMTAALVALIDDTATDVAGLAVKCLPPLVEQFSAESGAALLEQLFQKVSRGFDALAKGAPSKAGKKAAAKTAASSAGSKPASASSFR